MTKWSPVFWGVSNFKLPEDIKQRLSETLPKEAIRNIEIACQGYIEFKDNFTEKPTPSTDRKEAKNLAEKINTFITAADDLSLALSAMAQTLGNRIKVHAHELYCKKGGIYHEVCNDEIKIQAVIEDVEALNDCLQGAIGEIPYRLKDEPGRFLIARLIDIYVKATGKEPPRSNNPYTGESEISPIAKIVEILAPLLECGTLTGTIREICDLRNDSHKKKTL